MSIPVNILISGSILVVSGNVAGGAMMAVNVPLSSYNNLTVDASGVLQLGNTTATTTSVGRITTVTGISGSNVYVNVANAGSLIFQTAGNSVSSSFGYTASAPVTGAPGAVFASVGGQVLLQSPSGFGIVIDCGVSQPMYTRCGTWAFYDSSTALGFTVSPSSTSPQFFFAETGTASIYAATRTSDAVVKTLTVQAQNAYASAVTNINGGALLLQGGAARTNGTNGLRGPVRCQLGADSSTGTMFEIAEPITNQRAVSLCQLGSGITTTQLPSGSGDGIAYLAHCATLPTAAPATGTVLASDSTGLHVFAPGAVMDQMIAAAPAGTQQTQAGKIQTYIGYQRTSNNTPTTALTIGTTTNKVIGLIVRAIARDVSGGTVGDSYLKLATFLFKNVSGTVTAATNSAGTSVATNNDTSMATCSVIASASGTNVLVQVVGLSGPTIDWTVTVEAIIN